jgi:rSAM/selenodomain-associated transferase 1
MFDSKRYYLMHAENETNMKRCLIVFAKEPIKGRVKTRLSPYLTESQCTELYKAFLKDIISMAQRIRCEERILAYESYNKDPAYLKKIASDFLLYRQKGKDLGQKMHNAFKFAKDNNASKVVIIGSDFPNLPVSFIEDAFCQLDTKDIVLGPSSDGGFYLIGLKIPHRGLFTRIDWGTNTVLKDTLRNARALKKKIARLEKWYDVDDPGTLIRLIRDLKRGKNSTIAKWTRRFLKI